MHFTYEAGDDVDGVLGTLTDDVDDDVVGSPTGPLRGKDQALRFYQRLFADLEEKDVTSIHRYYGDDFVVDESLWRGTAVGNSLGLPGRSRPVEFRILHVFEFTDVGTIRRQNVWMDTAAITAQLRDDTPSPFPSAPRANTPTPDQSAKAVVARFYQDFDRGDLSTLGSIVNAETVTAATPTVVATRRSTTSLVQVTGAARYVSTRPWSSSATHAAAWVTT